MEKSDPGVIQARKAWKLRQVLADLVAAADKAQGDLAPVGCSILAKKPYLDQYQLMVAIQDNLRAAVERARKVMKEEK